MQRRTVLKGIGGSVALSALAGSAFAGTGQSDPYEPLGRVEIEGTREAVVGPDGKTAYVAANTGFATVDVSDPANPTVLAERRNLLADRDDGPLQQIYDAKVSGDRLVVAGPANGLRGEVVHGFLLYDVSDPANPKRLAFHETDFPIHNCYITGGVVYLTAIDFDVNPVVIVDVSGDDPKEIGRWSPLDAKPAWKDVPPLFRVVHDVYVRDGIGYFAYWDAGVWMVDVSDPANPSFVAQVGGIPREELTGLEGDARMAEYVEPPGNAHYAMPNEDGTLLGVNAEAWDDPSTNRAGGPGGVELWDISNPTEATKLSTIEPERVSDETMAGTWTTSHNFDIRGDRLYTSWYQGGVKIHDISDPANPKRLTWWRQPRKASFWTTKLAGDFFVGASTDEQEGITGALYTFPDRAGEQANPPALDPTTSTGAGTTATPTTEEGAMRTTRTTETETPTASDSTRAEGGQPGFGIAAALSGLALGAWRLRNREE